MATTLASLVVKVGADVTGVTAGLTTLDKRVRSLKRQFGTVRDSTITFQGALTALAGATGLAFAAGKVFELGAAVEETASKFRTVFGPSVGDAQRFLDEYASTLGLTETKGRDLLATTAAIAQGMGFTQAASASFAEEIVRLSGDLSSFNNIPIADTSRAIQSALTGERESLKRLGIVIKESEVQSRALAMTSKATAAELTQQEKATATLALITERAGVAVGDLARTMDSPANQARRLVAEVLSVRDSLAHALLPAMAVVLGELTKTAGSEGFQGLSTRIRESSGVIAAWTKFAVEAFKTVALAIAAPIRIAFNLGEVIGKILTASVQAMTGNFAEARTTIGSMIGDFGDMRESIANVIAGFDNMRVASAVAWETTASGSAALVGGGGAGAAGASGTPLAVALDVTAASARNMAVAVEMGALKVQDFSAGLRVTTQNANMAAEATDRLAAAQSRLSGAAGLLGTLGRIPGLGALGALTNPLGIFSGLVSGFRSTFGGGRAHGGPVQAGRAYTVGERGPETFVPQQSGTVVPSGGVNVSFTFPRAMSASDAIRDPIIARLFAEQLRNAYANGFTP